MDLKAHTQKVNLHYYKSQEIKHLLLEQSQGSIFPQEYLEKSRKSLWNLASLSLWMSRCWRYQWIRCALYLYRSRCSQTECKSPPAPACTRWFINETGCKLSNNQEWPFPSCHTNVLFIRLYNYIFHSAGWILKCLCDYISRCFYFLFWKVKDVLVLNSS